MSRPHGWSREVVFPRNRTLPTNQFALRAQCGRAGRASSIWDLPDLSLPGRRGMKALHLRFVLLR
jgi:hypothetical protein